MIKEIMIKETYRAKDEENKAKRRWNYLEKKDIPYSSWWEDDGTGNEHIIITYQETIWK